MKLDDPYLDSVDLASWDEWLAQAAREQIAFMRAEVPFWSRRLQGRDAHERNLQSAADLARWPILSKAELRQVRPAELLPNGGLPLKLCRWTSGTSGRPTANFWSDTDWAALVASTARALGRQAPRGVLTAFNGYSQGHVTGPLYHDALGALGALVYDRSHHAEELFPTVSQMDLFEFNTLVLPASTTPGKGIGLRTLLEDDPQALARRGVKWWIGSSGTFDEATVNRARGDSELVVSNLYGSSEFGLFAISCARTPRNYHLVQGHVLVEVVDESGKAVRHGEFGRIVVTHLCGMDATGERCLHGGTQILRLAAGDGATWLSEPCDCELTTPRLRGVRRIE